MKKNWEMKIAEVALTIVFLICVTIRCLEKSATSFRRNNWKRGQRRYFLISSCNIWPLNSQSWYLIWKPSHIWNQDAVWSDTPRNTTVAWCTVSKPIREGRWLKEPWLEHQAVIWAKMQEFKLWSLFWFQTHTHTTLHRCISWNEVFGGLQALVSSVVPPFLCCSTGSFGVHTRVLQLISGSLLRDRCRVFLFSFYPQKAMKGRCGEINLL